MKLIMREPPRENPQFDQATLESAAAEAFVEVFDHIEGPISFSEDGVVFSYAGRKFLFKVKINLIKEV